MSKIAIGVDHQDFVNSYMIPRFFALRAKMGLDYPRVFALLGNDDPRSEEVSILEGARHGCWEYVHFRKTLFGDFTVYGYAFVPPTPFLLKDWERYDVSRFVDPGCLSPEEGRRSVPQTAEESKYATIAKDLEKLTGADDVSRAILLFHTPPYETPLDRAALDGRTVEHVPLDVHIGSIAVRRFIETRSPLVTLHGHVHEAARLTGKWKTKLGATVSMTAAHEGPELALVSFDPAEPEGATRRLI